MPPMAPFAPFQFRGNSNYRGSRPNPRHEFTFRYQKPATSDRPLLSSKRESTPERLQGESETKPELRFAELSTLSDSEEAEMDMSDDSDTERPRKRRAVALDGPQEAVPAPVPKWSNPDPYTALPPPAETTNKRVDVVKLIRKARLDIAAKTDETDAVKQNSDFISLGMAFEPEISQSNAPDNAPKGPKAQDVLDPAIASRKRTRDDEIKGYSRKTGKPASRFNYDGSVIDQWRPLSPETGTPWFEGTPPSLHVGTQLHNEILSFYHWAKPQEFEHIVRADLVNRLETAFQQRYHNVSIRAFGSFASGLYLPTADIDLVLLSHTFLRTGVRTFGERKGQIYAFSAFLKSTNLAVPNSIECIASARVPILKYVDKLTGLRVDLSFDNDSGLIANETFQKWKSQYPMMPVILAVIKQFLLIRGLNEVPTGGLGGFSITCLVTSILQHLPQGHMQPNLATILLDFFNFYGKEFCYDRLAIRMDPPGYFNKVSEFWFAFVNQPANHVKQGYYFGNPDRLTIEDPNNRDNDISGGTKEIGLIFRAFSNAQTALRNRMEYLALVQGSNKSILEPIIAANFDEYIEQRFQLRQVFMTEERFARYREAPPPPPPPGSPPANEASPPPPPPPVDGARSLVPAAAARKPAKKAKGNSKGTKSEPEDISSDEAPESEAKSAKARKGETRRQLCQERAARLKRLRPDLTKLPNTLSLRQARRHAGYETDEQMNADLDRREQKLLASA
ncbi:hypothetical protein N7517_011107 [Penicillium concentricum]|uniref:polynucleotide adenylyltransferase n=1 Tax=Penicillium concentricum TaxID=293559 RepID=A0A9W9UT22_9EURO|nr:uncharacterized protein N7517_011107 [Penicillium concentricum]KAJ5356498.1 hypothetical protein N7517_011107 [Penicillium concentricum]